VTREPVDFRRYSFVFFGKVWSHKGCDNTEFNVFKTS